MSPGTRQPVKRRGDALYIILPAEIDGMTGDVHSACISHVQPPMRCLVRASSRSMRRVCGGLKLVAFDMFGR
jgi:hypothetical protein